MSAVLLITAIGAGAAWAAQQPKTHTKVVFVYYGNETAERAQEQSSNLKTLLTLLHQSNAPVAGTLASTIESDLSGFRKQAGRDETALLDAARRIGFDLAVFTNNHALDGEYVFYRHSENAARTRPFPPVPEAPNEILAFAPLARPETFRAALEDVVAQYPHAPPRIVLVTFSHGTLDMALMPRVNTDLSTPEAVEGFKRSLEHGGGGDAPDWARTQGTDKTTFWKILSDISTRSGVSFPLVFRHACTSGPNSLGELMAIPASVATVAHSARYNLNVDQIDYSAVFAGSAPGSDWVAHLTSELDERGITLSTARTNWIWAGLGTLYGLPPALFFIPVVLWLIFYGPRLIAMVRAVLPGRARARAGS